MLRAVCFSEGIHGACSEHTARVWAASVGREGAGIEE